MVCDIHNCWFNEAIDCTCAGASEQEHETLQGTFTRVFQRLATPMNLDMRRSCFFSECEEAGDAVSVVDPNRVGEDSCSRDVERGRRQAITTVVLTPHREAWWPQAHYR